MRLWLRRLAAKLLNPFWPHLSGCKRCSRNWGICQAHYTMFSDSDGMFPLCELCWRELSVPERLWYYYVLFEAWQARGPHKAGEWPAIVAAVQEGK